MNKLDELTKRLYEEGVSKGNEEAIAIVEKAKKEASELLKSAQEEAQQIIKKADEIAQEKAKNSQTEIALASKQALSTLKEQVSNLIVAKSTSETVKSATLDSEFIKKMLISVAENWKVDSSGKISLEALLPADKKKELGAAFEKSAKELLDKGIEVSFSDKVKSGFKVAPKGEGYYIAFSDEDFNALIGEYLRPELAKLIFE